MTFLEFVESVRGTVDDVCTMHRYLTCFVAFAILLLPSIIYHVKLLPVHCAMHSYENNCFVIN